MNSCLFIGRLTRNAEVIATKNGDPSARFTLAVDKRFGGKGKDKKEPDWIPCSLFGDRANMLAPFLEKGKLVGVAGTLASYRVTNQDGTSTTRLVVNVDEVQFLPSNRDRQEDATDFPVEETQAPDGAEELAAFG